MKKWFWFFPALVFLVSLGIVLYLRARDVNPALLIGAAGPADWASRSETDAVLLLEKNLSAFEAAASGGALPEGVVERAEGGALVLERRLGGFVQALIPPGAEVPEPEPALNAKTAMRSLPINGWKYVYSADVPLALAHRYADIVAAQLDKGRTALPAEEWVFLLQEKEGLPEPAAYSKSAYVVKVYVPFDDGTFAACFVDPKTFVFLGFAR